MYKALIIGCGNIGAGYDFDNDRIITHAKALHLNSNFELFVFDLNQSLANKVAQKYNGIALKELTNEVLQGFDLISLCTPTATHFEWLCRLFELNVPLIICEKPVSYSPQELQELRKLGEKSNSKVLVNYVRRFQPAYTDLRNEIELLLKKEPLLNIQINYQNGFINNCSHALDLIEFIFNKPINFEKVNQGNKVFDFLPYDPTLSLQANWEGVNIGIFGILGINYGLLNIDFFFQFTQIRIGEAGQTIEISDSSNRSLEFPLLKKLSQRTDCNKDFMVAVIKRVEMILKGEIVEDNFQSSIELNVKMLNYLNN